MFSLLHQTKCYFLGHAAIWLVWICSGRNIKPIPGKPNFVQCTKYNYSIFGSVYIGRITLIFKHSKNTPLEKLISVLYTKYHDYCIFHCWQHTVSFGGLWFGEIKIFKLTTILLQTTPLLLNIRLGIYHWWPGICYFGSFFNPFIPTSDGKIKIFPTVKTPLGSLISNCVPHIMIIGCFAGK